MKNNLEAAKESKMTNNNAKKIAILKSNAAPEVKLAALQKLNNSIGPQTSDAIKSVEYGLSDAFGGLVKLEKLTKYDSIPELKSELLSIRNQVFKIRDALKKGPSKYNAAPEVKLKAIQELDNAAKVSPQEAKSLERQIKAMCRDISSQASHMVKQEFYDDLKQIERALLKIWNVHGAP